MYHEDTICALATGAHSGGIGIVRISGPDTRAVIERVSQWGSGELKPHHLQFARFVDADNRVIDEGYVAWMPAPRSYTCEDCAELQAHGGSVNLSRLCRAVVAAGARPAERGEFTLRAFLNGRIDLCQAEAVLDVVQARTETALEVAHNQLQGSISQRVGHIVDSLVNVMALLEAQIDFVEEDLDDAHSRRPTAMLAAAKSEVSQLAASFRRGKILRSGVRVVLLGAPNAGKSSLFNALLRASRAIVTDIPGTTRDFLEETMDLDGIPVTLVDTAGIHEPGDEVEAQGVERALALAADADLVLALTDAASGEEFSLPHGVVDPDKLMSIRTKADLAPGDVSAMTGQGIDSLVTRIRKFVLPSESAVAGQTLVTSARHHEALQAGQIALERATIASQTESPDVTAVEVQEAVHQLGLIVGVTTTEDVLDRVFSSFCIGK